MEKHTSYYNLLEQLKDPSCPVCAQSRLSLKSFLDTYLYEGVNDDTNWNRLSAAGGWCSRHAGRLEGFSDGLAVALFYRFEIRKRLKNLGQSSSGWFRSAPKSEPCPACTYEAEIEAGQCHLFSRALGEEEFFKAFHAHPGACLPHSERILGLLKGGLKDAVQKLVTSQFETLAVELDEIVRKSDYRVDEKLGVEGDAWRRALARMHGTHYQS